MPQAAARVPGWLQPGSGAVGGGCGCLWLLTKAAPLLHLRRFAHAVADALGRRAAAARCASRAAQAARCEPQDGVPGEARPTSRSRASPLSCGWLSPRRDVLEPLCARTGRRLPTAAGRGAADVAPPLLLEGSSCAPCASGCSAPGFQWASRPMAASGREQGASAFAARLNHSQEALLSFALHGGAGHWLKLAPHCASTRSEGRRQELPHPAAACPSSRVCCSWRSRSCKWQRMPRAAVAACSRATGRDSCDVPP